MASGHGASLPPDAPAMPDKKPAPEKKKHALETEVIWAVIGLYVFIAGVLLLIHHLQPQGQETKSSSPSPSHAAQYGVPGGEPHEARP
ncbi:MAG: hypothetical protein JHD33_09500 [Chthoniobacterales bacterium]|nr:hypothetical protein [Chthoniobacterales bacterium]